MPVGVPEFSGRKMRALRKRRGMSQMELAAASGLHYHVIGILERGERPPTPGSVRKIARGLRVREYRLLDRSGDAAA